MVLSNKKLKEKLRAQLTEALAKSESQANQSNLNDSQTPQSFKSLLNLVTQKPKLSKREKRRVTVPSNHENGDEKRESEEGSNGLKTNKKRKREKDGVEAKEVNEAKDLSENKNSKKKNKKKKNKKKKVVVKEESVLQKPNAVSEEQEQAVAEPIQIHTSNEDANISTKIYVGGIPYYSTVDDIRSFFEHCGSITEIDCLKFPETGKFNGIAMISFRTEAASKRALALDGSDMGGLSLKVQPYKATRDKRVSDFAPAMLEGYNRIYVGNLSWDMTEDELKKFFSDCSISSIRLGKDKETGEFKGFAHVDFSDSLSLTMALKLDQKPLFGRPVRIRCAVPPKSVNPSSNPDPTFGKNEVNGKLTHSDVTDDVARKLKRQTCYECGEKGHLSSSCPKKQAADVAKSGRETFASVDSQKVDDKVIEFVGDAALKWRTCYECGERGHLSLACPKRQVADVANSGREAFGSVLVVDNDVSDSKVKRRTCYECGERGHLSSACPKKQDADVANSGREAFDVREVVDEKMIQPVSDGKLRRRTCYECGERGHLSSLCPKKVVADVADDMEVEKAEVAEVVDNVVSEGKLRRRTCYECGERGHLSSLCPKKQAADVANVRKEEPDDVEVEALKTTVADVVSGKIRRRTCYECGEKGHLSSLCPNKKEADA
ncbi:hypothetical protein Lser_V15G44282 [Lactuca serriola]